MLEMIKPYTAKYRKQYRQTKRTENEVRQTNQYTAALMRYYQMTPTRLQNMFRDYQNLSLTNRIAFDDAMEDRFGPGWIYGFID